MMQPVKATRSRMTAADWLIEGALVSLNVIGWGAFCLLVMP